MSSYFSIINLPLPDSSLITKTTRQYFKNDSIRVCEKVESVTEQSVFTWKKFKSISLKQNVAKQKFSQSLFVNHKLQTKKVEQYEKSFQSDSFPAILLLLMLLILAVTRQANIKRFNDTVKAFFIPRIATQLNREENSLTNRTSLALLFVFVLSGALFMYQMALSFGFYPLLIYGKGSFFIFCVAIFLIYLVKIATLRFFSYVFQTEAIFYKYSFLIITINQLLGLILIPITACIAFAHILNEIHLINLGSFVIVSVLVFRLIRGSLTVVSRPNISRFYLFLYLCTLEILPMVILIKAFTLVFGKQ